jgi:hypothetical protein
MTSEVVKQLVNEEIQTLIQQSVSLKTSKDTAKTSIKRTYFAKKLAQNNELVLKYLTAAKQLHDKQDAEEIVDGSITTEV